MLASLLVSAACLAKTAITAPVESHESLVFEDCPAALVPKGTTMKCGSIQVPMDWTENSTSDKITIGVTKIPAKDPSKRIGPLFFNPGGPGQASSLSLAEIVLGVTPMHGEILDAFDIIGVDVRGCGLSTPITCSGELFNMPPDIYPTTPESYDAQAKLNREFRQSCLSMTGSNLIDYMDTVSTANDHEAVRKALGGEKLTWLVQSYGTLLASQYAELYAEYVRGMVLDGVTSTSQAPTAEFVTDAASTEATMNRFFDVCSTSDKTYCVALRKNATKPLPELWSDLLARAAASSIPAPECKSGAILCPTDSANLYQLLEGATQLLYPGEQAYPELAAAMQAALFENDASAFLGHAFQVPKGTNTYNASQVYALVAIACQDLYDVEASADLMYWWRQIAMHDMPHTLGLTPAVFLRFPCMGYPKATRNPRHRLHIPDTLSAKALLISNSWDPSTPTAWALEVQEEIGVDRAVVIGRNKPGHTSYFIPQAYNGPTVAAINHYLLTLETPEQRTMFDN